MKVNKKAYEFFNSLSGTLDVTLSEDTVSIGGLLNQRALPGTKIIKMYIELKVITNEDDYDTRDLTKDDLNQVVFEDVDFIELNGQDYHSDSMTSIPHYVTCKANKKRSFTVKDLIKAVLKTEKKTRKMTEWFGGIDVHHIYFEGLVRIRGNKFQIYWGS